MRKNSSKSLGKSFAIQLSRVCAIGFCQTVIAQEAFPPSWWDRTESTVLHIAKEGNLDLYLSGYAHHSRSTYAEKRLGRLNEKATGGGVGKTFRNERGNDESLYAIVIRDSNRNYQWSAGYAYQWIHSISEGSFELGAGLSAGLIARKDWFDGFPFPAVLPVFSAGMPRVKLMGTYVPKLSTRKGKGNVLLLFGKVEF